MNQLTLAIDGMSCAHCVARVKQALDDAPGVQVNHVAIGTALLTYDGAATTPSEIAAAVSAVGYPARATSAASATGAESPR